MVVALSTQHIRFVRVCANRAPGCRYGDPSPVMPLRRLSSNMSHNLVKYAEEKESKVVGLTPSGTAFTRSTGTARTEDRSARLSRCAHAMPLLW